MTTSPVFISNRSQAVRLPKAVAFPENVQIGGHARSEGLIIVTNNMREFTRMPGVRVENWV